MDASYNLSVPSQYSYLISHRIPELIHDNTKEENRYAKKVLKVILGITNPRKWSDG